MNRFTLYSRIGLGFFIIIILTCLYFGMYIWAVVSLVLCIISGFLMGLFAGESSVRFDILEFLSNRQSVTTEELHVHIAAKYTNIDSKSIDLLINDELKKLIKKNIISTDGDSIKLEKGRV